MFEPSGRTNLLTRLSILLFSSAQRKDAGNAAPLKMIKKVKATDNSEIKNYPKKIS